MAAITALAPRAARANEYCILTDLFDVQKWSKLRSGGVEKMRIIKGAYSNLLCINECGDRSRKVAAKLEI